MRSKVCLAVLTAVFQASEAQACAVVPHPGETARIAEESALIVWDEKRGVEHFIRRAVFDTGAKDFGFLVPTPTEPELGEADEAIFQRLVDWTQPPPRAVAAAGRSERGIAVAKAEAPAPAVAVLQTTTVAGLDAAVLKANDANALDAWLKKHGYASSPTLVTWFKPYIERRWLITAFKIAKSDAKLPRAVTTAVRMSFKTDRPFYPYREPDSKIASGATRALEVFFLGQRRVDGRIGVGTSWPGRTLWSDDLGWLSRKVLAGHLKLPGDGLPSESVRLTRFVDLSSPRPGNDELYFSPAVQSEKYVDAVAIEAENERRAAASRIALPPIALTKPDDFAAALEQADGLEKQGDYRSAVRVLRSSARQGNAKAALRLGDYYEKGRPGIVRDWQEALSWYDKARELGEQAPVVNKR